MDLHGQKPIQLTSPHGLRYREPRLDSCPGAKRCTTTHLSRVIGDSVSLCIRGLSEVACVHSGFFGTMSGALPSPTTCFHAQSHSLPLLRGTYHVWSNGMSVPFVGTCPHTRYAARMYVLMRYCSRGCQTLSVPIQATAHHYLVGWFRTTLAHVLCIVPKHSCVLVYP